MDGSVLQSYDPVDAQHGNLGEQGTAPCSDAHKFMQSYIPKYQEKSYLNQPMEHGHLQDKPYSGQPMERGHLQSEKSYISQSMDHGHLQDKSYGGQSLDHGHLQDKPYGSQSLDHGHIPDKSYGSQAMDHVHLQQDKSYGSQSMDHGHLQQDKSYGTHSLEHLHQDKSYGNQSTDHGILQDKSYGSQPIDHGQFQDKPYNSQSMDHGHLLLDKSYDSQPMEHSYNSAGTSRLQSQVKESDVTTSSLLLGSKQYGIQLQVTREGNHGNIVSNSGTNWLGQQTTATESATKDMVNWSPHKSLSPDGTGHSINNVNHWQHKTLNGEPPSYVHHGNASMALQVTAKSATASSGMHDQHVTDFTMAPKSTQLAITSNLEETFVNRISNGQSFGKDISGQYSSGLRPHSLTDQDTSCVEQSEDGSLKSATKDYTEINLPAELMGKMFGLLKEGMFCDAVILAGDKEIRVHKMVLIAASPFLLSKMSKTTPSTSLRVELPAGIPLQVASQLVHYLYDGKVTLTTDNVSQFARIANLFRLDHLSNICYDFVQRFNLEKSVLNVLEEDMNVFCTVPEEQKPSKVLQSKEVCVDNSENKLTKGAMKNTIKGKKKIVNKFKQKLVSEDVIEKPSPATPSNIVHMYGTRAASAAKMTKVSTENTPPYKDNNTTVITNTAEGSCVKKGKKVTDWQKLLASITAEDMNIPVKELEENEIAAAKLDSNEMDSHSDFDEIDLYHGKTKTKSSMTASVRKTALLKKSKRLQHKLKKTVIPPTLKAADPPLRPPPKKRVREFTDDEEQQMQEIIQLKSDTTSTAPIPDAVNISSSKVNKKKGNKKKGKEKLKDIDVEPETVQGVTLTKSMINSYCSQLDKLAQHIAEHERQYICNYCGNEFVFPKRCFKHTIINHKVHPDEALDSITIRKYEKTPKVCDICSYETKEPNFYYIHYHKYFRHGVPLPRGWKPFKCEICGKECFTKFQLKDHKLVHNEDTPFICEICGTGFKVRTSLNSHVFHKHSNIRKHQCKDCEKSFKTRTQLLVHTRTHTGERPFTCPNCEYKSTTRGNMRLHLTNKHRLGADTIAVIMGQIQLTSLSNCPESVDQVTEVAQAEEVKGELSESNKSKNKSVFKQRAVKCKKQNQEKDEISSIMPTKSLENSSFENIVIASSQSGQIVYTNENIGPRHIILQHYTGNPQASEENIHQSQNAVILPTDSLSGTHHFILQTNPGEAPTLLPADGTGILQDGMPQDTHIIQAQEVVMQGSVPTQDIIMQGSEQLPREEGQEQQTILYTPTQYTAEGQGQQILLVNRSGDIQQASAMQALAKHTPENKKVLPRLLIDSRHPGVEIHIPMEVNELESSQGQIIPQQNIETVGIEHQGQSLTMEQQESSLHELKGVIDLQKQPQVVQISLGTAVSQNSLSDCYQMTMAYTSPTAVVGTQSNEGYTEVEVSAASSSGSPSMTSSTQASQSYSDPALYQYYQQGFHNF